MKTLKEARTEARESRISEKLEKRLMEVRSSVELEKRVELERLLSVKLAWYEDIEEELNQLRLSSDARTQESDARTKELGELRLRNHQLTMEMSKVRRELNQYINKAIREKQRQKDICWVPEATLREVTSELHAEQKMRRRLCGQGLENCTDAELQELCEKINTAQERVTDAMERRAAETRVTEKNLNYQCPISQSMMRDPVVTVDGQSYERKNIEQWFKMCKDSKEPISSPLRAPLASDLLVPNNSLRHAIEDALDFELLCLRTERAAKRARSD